MNEVTIHHGDCLEKLKGLASESVHCVVTSPPYWGLRDYGTPDAIGLEPTFEEHLKNLIKVFAEVMRVLRPDGTLWLNYGDAYATTPNGQKVADKRGDDRTFRDKPIDTTDFLKAKNLMLMPARVAIALQERGWILRSEIIWHKPNPMPESTTDRPTSAHEKVFLFSKRQKYYYDADAICTSPKYPEDSTEKRKARALASHKSKPSDRKNGIRMKVPDGWDTGKGGHGTVHRKGREKGEMVQAEIKGVNLRNVWTISTQGFPEVHFATFPPALVEPCVKAGTSEKGCCPDCGTPWERVFTKELVSRRGNVYTERSEQADKNDAGANRARDGHRPEGYYKVRTLGWRPTCDCYDAEYKKFPKPRKMRKKLQRMAWWKGWWERVRARPGLDSWQYEHAIVLDPFAGAGTVGVVASKLNRNAVLIEIKQQYIEIARKRILAETGPMFTTVRTDKETSDEKTA